MASRFDYLRNRIENNVWLGKEILATNDFIWNIIDAPMNYLTSLSPFSFIYNSAPLSYLRAIFDNAENFLTVATNSALVFIESCYGINKKFNSNKYENLSAKGNSILGSLSLNEDEVRICESAFRVQKNLNPEGLQEELNRWGFQAVNYYSPQLKQDWEDRSTNLLEQRLAQFQAMLVNLVGQAKYEVNRIIKRIQFLLTKSVNLKSQQSQQSQQSKQLIQPVITSKYAPIIVAPPSISLAISVVNSLASFFLEVFFGLTNLLPAISYCVTGMVLKLMDGAGAIACDYLCGGLLRNAGQSLPVLYQYTGLNAGAWGFLMLYAPAIIITTIILTLCLQSNTTMGENLFILAGDDTSYEVLMNSTNQEIYNELLNLANELPLVTGKNYVELNGYSVNNKGKVEYGVNFTDLENPLPIDIFTANTLFTDFVNSLEPSQRPLFI